MRKLAGERKLTSLRTGIAYMLLLVLALSCNIKLGGDKDDSDKEDDIAKELEGDASSAMALTGSLNLTDGVNLVAYLIGSDEEDEGSILKATYADAKEDTGKLLKDGSYTLKIKPFPFSVTVFTNKQPVCSFLFQVGDNSVGSMQLESDTDLGSLSCEDGQAVVPEDVIKGNLSEEFKKKVKAGEISQDIKDILFNPTGVQMTILSMRGGGDKGGGGDNGPNNGPNSGDMGPNNGPQGPGMGPNNGPNYLVANQDCRDCGGQGFDPRNCAKAGYKIPNFMMGQHNDGGEGKKDDGGTRTLFFVEKEGGLYDLIARDTDSETGKVKDDIFSNIKLGGFGDDFAMVGKSIIDQGDLKSRVAEHEIRNLMNRLRDHSDSWVEPTNFDPFCDPLNLVNKIRRNAGNAKFDGIEGLFGEDNMDNHIDHRVLPLCSAQTPSEEAAGPLTILDFCFEADGTTLKAHSDLTGEALTSANNLCIMAKAGAPVEYNTDLVDESGNFVQKCIRNYQVKENFKENWFDEVTALTKEECDAKQQEQWNTEQEPGTVHDNYNFGGIRVESGRDCSVLRKAGVELQACLWINWDHIFPGYQWPDFGEPMNYRQSMLTEVDAMILESKSSGFGNDDRFGWLKKDVEMCLANISRSAKTLLRKKDNLTALVSRVTQIINAVDKEGKPRYISETASEFKQAGHFSMTKAEADKLKNVLEKAKTAVDGWSNSIKDIKDTYAKIKSAALTAANDGCLSDDIADKTIFQAFYETYKVAVKGNKDDKENPGMDKLMQKYFNHDMCMNMDENLNMIREFSLTAPMRGIADSNIQNDDDAIVDDAFLTSAQDQEEKDSCDSERFDNYGKCVEEIKCSVPAGGQDFIAFDTLLELAVIEDGCDKVEEKVAMIGRKNQRKYTIQAMTGFDERGPRFEDYTIDKGALVANISIKTRLPKQNCKITLKFPKMDKNSCWVFKNEAGKSWAELTADELKTASGTDFALQFNDEQVSMRDVGSDEFIEAVMAKTDDNTVTNEEDVNDSAIDDLFESTK